MGRSDQLFWFQSDLRILHAGKYSQRKCAEEQREHIAKCPTCPPLLPLKGIRSEYLDERAFESESKRTMSARHTGSDDALTLSPGEQGKPGGSTASAQPESRTIPRFYSSVEADWRIALAHLANNSSRYHARSATVDELPKAKSVCAETSRWPGTKRRDCAQL